MAKDWLSFAPCSSSNRIRSRAGPWLISVGSICRGFRGFLAVNDELRAGLDYAESKVIES